MNSVIDTARAAELNRDSITQLGTPFYTNVRADSLLGPVFEAVLGKRWASHLPCMVAFWSTVMLGGRSFPGNVFAKNMAVLGVTALHFERWLRLWALHTGTMFDGAQEHHQQKVASDIARNLYRGHFGNAAGFDVIALETRHGGR